MPRPNPSRSLAAEANLARRVAAERERRGWSNDGLAGRMTAAGCPIQASAIFKIEKGDPPRRITVNELVGFSAVFGIPLTDLLQEPGSLTDLEVTRLLFRVEDAVRELNSAVGAMEELTRTDPGKRPALRWTLRDLYDDWPEIKSLFRAALRGEIKYQSQPQPESSMWPHGMFRSSSEATEESQ